MYFSTLDVVGAGRILRQSARNLHPFSGLSRARSTFELLVPGTPCWVLSRTAGSLASAFSSGVVRV